MVLQWDVNVNWGTGTISIEFEFVIAQFVFECFGSGQFDIIARKLCSWDFVQSINFQIRRKRWLQKLYVKWIVYEEVMSQATANIPIEFQGHPKT